MLYDGALRFLSQGMKALDEGDLERCNNNLLRVQDIVFELIASLDYQAGGWLYPWPGSTITSISS